MEHGQSILKKERSERLLVWGIHFFMAAALTASQTSGNYAPFALGYLAAAGPGSAGAAALAGTCGGALLFLRFEDALPHLAVAVLVLAAATAFQGVRLLNRPGVIVSTATGLFLGVGGIYVVQSSSPLEDLTVCLVAAGLTGVSAWFFLELIRRDAEHPQPDSVVFLAAALCIAILDLTVAKLSLGRILLCVLLAYTAYDRGTVTGVSAGLGLGLMADLCTGTGSGVFTAGFGVAGLLAGSRSGRRRSEAAGVFLLAVMVVLLPSRADDAPAFLVESAVGMVLFLMLPGCLFGGKRIKREVSDNGGAAVKARLTKAASALRDIYDSLGRSVPQSTEENPAIVFDRAAEKVCRDCALCELCWQKEYTGTFNALNDATPYLLERGRGMVKDFPQYFADRCIHLQEFIGAVNGELSAFLLRRQYRRQLEETRRSAKGQYAQLSELLTATAAGFDESFGTAVQTTCRIGAVLRPKEGESVCGDTITAFQNGRGTWFLLLADGMGCGEEARRESSLTCRLLQQFLEADIHPEAALKTLNAAMSLRGSETGSFATVDLCMYEPGSGEVSFYKYGAAPSYLKRGGSVRRVTGSSLPVGLRGGQTAPDVTRTILEPGGFVVVISDGVADAGRDEWLMDLLAGWSGEDPQVLAGKILAESIRREQLQDDCGIQVLYCPEEPGKKV